MNEPVASSPSRSSAAALWTADTSVPLVEGTVGDELRRRATSHPTSTAFLWPEGDHLLRMTYAELLAEAEATARALAAEVTPGDRVCIWGANSIDWVLCDYAITLSGGVVVPLNTAWTDFEAAQALDLVSPRILLHGVDGRGSDLGVRARTLAAELNAPPGVRSLAECRALRPASPVELPALSETDPYLIQFTSGTTGQAKGAVLSHRCALNAGFFRSWAAEVDDTDVWLNPLPLHHVSAAVTLVLCALTTGSAMVLLSHTDAEDTVRWMRATGATRIGGVPTLVTRILDLIEGRGSTYAIRGVGMGGTSIPEELVRRVVTEFGVPISIGYGQSECPIITSSRRTDPIASMVTTNGRPLPHTEVRIVDPLTGATVGAGESGEICVRSPMVMDRYFANPAASAETIEPDGTLHTGDVGYLDPDGRLVVRGRIRDVVIRGGENIYPAEVEAVLSAHPAVGQIAVIGLPDHHYGQRVAAVVQLIDAHGFTDDNIAIADLAAFGVERLAYFKVPVEWHALAELPMTASGKVRKVDLIDRYATP
jgi:fatty-acyl-CoA synthase